METQWTRAFYGIQHLGRIGDLRSASVSEYKTFTVLALKWAGYGFSPRELYFDTVAEAKAAGEQWVAQIENDSDTLVIPPTVLENIQWAHYLCERAKHLRPKCPECGAEQVQLTDWSVDPTQWRCRECRHKFFVALEI